MISAFELFNGDIVLISLREFEDTMCPDVHETITMIDAFIVETTIWGKPTKLREIDAEELEKLYKEVHKKGLLYKDDKIALWKFMMMKAGRWCDRHNCSTNKCVNEDHTISPF